MSRLPLSLAVAACAGLLPSAAAYAAFPCAATSAPAAFSGAGCNGGAGFDTCQLVGNVWACALGRNLGLNPAQATAVEGFGTAGELSVWGWDARGSNFCCASSNAVIDVVEVVGSPQNDQIWFQANVGATMFDLDTHDGAALDGVAKGQNGDDDIFGSRVSSANYVEILEGNDGHDEIFGNQGDDQIRGGAGDDDLYGGGGHDAISGGLHNDYIQGDSGNDLICLDDGINQQAFGNQNDDVLFVPASGATGVFGDGGPGTDTCGDSSTIPPWALSCTHSVAVRPACPAP